MTRNFTKLLYIGVIIFIITVVFIRIPDNILYARSGLNRWLPFLLIFGFFPYAIFQLLKDSIPKYSFLISVGSLLIIGPLFAIQLTRLDRLALQRKGEVAVGTVTKKWEFKPTNRDPEWMLQASFQAYGTDYLTNPCIIDPDDYKEGEEIQIIYAAMNPNINMPLRIFEKLE